MKTKNFIGNRSSRRASLYLIASLLLLLMLGGCGNDSREVTGTLEPTEEPEPTEEAVVEDFLPAGKKHGNISVSEDGKTIYVHGWVYVYELSDRRTKKAKKIVFCKDAGIIYEENDGTIAYIPRLQDAPLVEKIEVEEGNSTLYEVDGMLVKRAEADEYTEDEMLVFCVPGKKGEVGIPEGIQVIDDCAFFGCSGVTSVFLPSSIAGMGDAVFSGMKTCTSIQANEENKVYYSKDGVLYGRSSASIDKHPCVVAYPAGKLDSVYNVAPKHIEEIKEGAFLGANHLKEVYLPSRVKVIQRGAFQKCKKLEKVIVKNKKRITVEGDAFDDCPRLKEHVKDKDNF